ncbi:hypothetical protein [Mesobacillus subterraneus]|uniref:Uncharacterized protein n=1 Tax=Mesobacillus subterraneus TaxID=285983 RepID=A0A427TPI1_9BACI|nr:hypothetical protein [Mesobacillus subterraneus]RSD26291.1 hypothetical protein EJA10_15915 [Mesobacillus subterraneus]
MRFLYKRKPAEALRFEIQAVRDVMCSGHFVLLDLLFYSFLFALLIMPVTTGMLQFGGVLLLIYSTFACLFLLIRKIFHIIDYSQK